jgi:hypothetical protein
MMMSSDNESGITAAGPYPSLLPDATQQPVGVDVSSTATTSEARLRDGDSSNNDSSDNYSFDDDDDDDDDDDGGNSEDDDGANESSSVPQAMVSTGLDWEAGEQERKEQKEKFILFTKTLMESLEKEDLALHAKVKATMDDCKKRSEQGELGYEYVTTSMRIRLKEAVNHGHWKRIETNLEKALMQKEEERRQKEEERRQIREGIQHGYNSRFDGRQCFFDDRRKAEKDVSLFCRVLVKCLEQKDPTLQAKVEAIIKECVKQKWQERKRAFNTDIDGMKSRLRELVSDDHWKGAEMWADNFGKVLADFRAEVGVIVRSADKATSFLQSLPVDPMSQVLVDTALSEVLCKDLLLQVAGKAFCTKEPQDSKDPKGLSLVAPCLLWRGFI